MSKFPKINNKTNSKIMQLTQKRVNQTSVIIPPHLNFLHFQAKTRKENQKNFFYKAIENSKQNQNSEYITVFISQSFQSLNLQEPKLHFKFRKIFNQTQFWNNSDSLLTVSVSHISSQSV